MLMAERNPLDAFLRPVVGAADLSPRWSWPDGRRSSRSLRTAAGASSTIIGVVSEDLLEQLHARVGVARAAVRDRQELMAQISEFVDWIAGQRDFAKHAKALEAEAFSLVENFDDHQQRLAVALEQIRVELETRFPEIERPRVRRPGSDDGGETTWMWLDSLAYFEQLTSEIALGPSAPRFSRHSGEDTCQTDRLLKILYSKIGALRQAEVGNPDVVGFLDHLEDRRASLAGQHQRVQRRLDDAVLAGASCALLRLQRLANNDPSAEGSDRERRGREWVNSVFYGRYGNVAPKDLAVITGMLPRDTPSDQDREALFELIRRDVELVGLDLDERVREANTYGGWRGKPVIGQIIRFLLDRRPAAVWAKILGAVLLALLSALLAMSNLFSSRAPAPWNLQVADICDNSNLQMTKIVGQSMRALLERELVSTRTALALRGLVSSSPAEQRVGFESYVNDRMAIAGTRRQIAAGVRDHADAKSLEAKLEHRQTEAEVDATHFAGLSVCGEIPNLE
jgi:hypothetical protein